MATSLSEMIDELPLPFTDPRAQFPIVELPPKIERQLEQFSKDVRSRVAKYERLLTRAFQRGHEPQWERSVFKGPCDDLEDVLADLHHFVEAVRRGLPGNFVLTQLESLEDTMQRRFGTADCILKNK